MEKLGSANFENSDVNLLFPGKNYLVKRLVKVLFWLIILDSFILGFFGILAILPFEEVTVGTRIFELGVLSTILLTLIIGIYHAIGTPWFIKTLSYKITDEALIVERGRLTKIKIFVPFRTITNVSITQGPFDRVFDVGHLSVETAGFATPLSGKMGVDQYIEGLEKEVLKETYNFIFYKIQQMKGIYSTTTEEDTIYIEGSEDKEVEKLPELIKELIIEIKEFRKTVEKLHG